MDENPLNPLGDSLDQFLDRTVSNDLWEGLLGDLPCADSSQECYEEIAALAVDNSPLIAEVDMRIQEAQDRVDEALSNNRRAIAYEILSPGLQYFLTQGQEQGRVAQPGETLATLTPLEKIGSIFTNPTGAINVLLQTIGIPFFSQILGNSDNTTSRSIRASELQVRIAELQRGRAELADKTREKVLLTLIETDQIKRKFQASQERLLISSSMIKLMEAQYRLGQHSTAEMITRWQGLTDQKVEVFENFNLLKTKLTLLRLLTSAEQ